MLSVIISNILPIEINYKRAVLISLVPLPPMTLMILTILYHGLGSEDRSTSKFVIQRQPPMFRWLYIRGIDNGVLRHKKYINFNNLNLKWIIKTFFYKCSIIFK